MAPALCLACTGFAVLVNYVVRHAHDICVEVIATLLRMQTRTCCTSCV